MKCATWVANITASRCGHLQVGFIMAANTALCVNLVAAKKYASLQLTGCCCTRLRHYKNYTVCPGSAEVLLELVSASLCMNDTTASLQCTMC